MNDAQAKTKWCPFAFARLSNSRAASNRSTANPADFGPCYCLGSRCAAWRGTDKSGRCGLASDKDAP